MMNEHYDVIVIGGGTAGVVAAVQAGRAGARTLLVEKTGMLGGTITNGGVNYPGLFHAWGQQVIAGIGWELVTRAVEEAGGTLPDFKDYKRPHHMLQVRVNSFIYAALCDEAAVGAGVDLLFHTMPAAVRCAEQSDGWQLEGVQKGCGHSFEFKRPRRPCVGGAQVSCLPDATSPLFPLPGGVRRGGGKVDYSATRCRSTSCSTDARSAGAGNPFLDKVQLDLCTKDGLTSYSAGVVIDATGDANVVALAGFPLNIPDESQPATLSCRATGYDPSALDYAAIDKAFEAEARGGRLCYTDVSWHTGAANVARWLRAGGANASHVHHINARNSQGKTRLELTARKSLLRLYRFLRQQPGLENFVIEQVSPECGVRETVTIKGNRTVTLDDYRSGRIWDDAVCYSFYVIDLHQSSGSGLRKEPLAEGLVPTIPRGALLPAGSRNLIVAGRCVASDRLANSALRVQASCMAMGQAAGAMAVLSAKSECTPAELPLKDIHGLLIEHGAIVPRAEQEN